MTRGLRVGVFVMALVMFECGKKQPPPLADPVNNARVTCSAQVQMCEAGVSLDNQCLGYGNPTTLQPDPFDGGCVSNQTCPTPVGQCTTIAANLCREPHCKLVPNGVSVVTCGARTCGVILNPPGGQNRPSPGQTVPDDPKAPFRLLSFQFTTASNFIHQNPPTRVIPISSSFGKPIAIDATGFLFTVTNFPDTIIGYDVMPNPPTFAIPPLTLIDSPNTFALTDAPLLLGNTVVGDIVGLSLYDVKAMTAKRTRQARAGPIVGLDLDPNFAMTNTAVGLTISPNTSNIVQFAVDQKPKSTKLPGTSVDVTMGTDDVWVITSSAPGSGTISRLANPTGTVLAAHSFADGDPIAIGGGGGVTNTIPGAIVMLAKTQLGGELRLFQAGNVNAPPMVIPFMDFPLAEPKALKIVTIDNTQYAWVALLVGTTNVVALFNLQAKTHLGAFDVDLNALEPLAVLAGVPSLPDSDVFSGTDTAFLHVLVKSN